MMSRPLLDVQGLRVGLPGSGDRRHAVKDLSFQVAAGETLCIVGESGSGKSVTALALLGLMPRGLRLEAGAALLEGQDLLAASPAELRAVRGQRASMIFQEPMTALNPVWTIGSQMLEVWSSHTRLNAAERREAMLGALADVRLPDPERIAACYPHQLSGGQRQRVMIAMALALRPSLLIADEPTTALDVTTQARILQLIKDMQAKCGMGVLFITHDFGVVADISDRALVMHHGEAVEAGATAAVLRAPQHGYTQRLIAAVPSLTPPDEARPHEAAAILSVSGVTKRFRTRSAGLGQPHTLIAVNAASLELRKGETLGIVGESGSGKSTLARIVLGLETADEGHIVFEGKTLNAASTAAWREARQRLQVVFQDPWGSLNRRRQVGDIIAQGPINYGMSKSEARERARALLLLVGLSEAAADRYPHEFSGGQRQRISIARALALEPKVLIADEAVSALDVSVQAQVLSLLRDLRARFGLSMLFITHDLRVAAQTCDRLIVMRKGEIVETGLVQDIFANPQHDYTRLLFEAAPGRTALA
jgi:peptide/nickel transport system ATP-binding protein